jgi:hypothetical protein
MSDPRDLAAAAVFELWASADTIPDAHTIADAVIAALPDLQRIEKVRQVCVASLNRDRVPGAPLTDRAWLADTVLNVLNGAVDE